MKKKPQPQLPPSESINISDALKEIFKLKSETIVIGLTGRTGCGCSTVSEKILTAKNFEETKWPRVYSPSENQETRKNRIVEDWMKKNWHPFKIIQVSNLIYYMALAEDIENSVELLNKICDNKLPDRAKDIFLKHKSQSKLISIAINKFIDGDTCDLTDAYVFFHTNLANISKEFKLEFNGIQKSIYTDLFQKLGDNIRKSGSPFSTKISTDALFTIPKLINTIIKLTIKHDKSSGNFKNYFAIDAIRHPYEIHYLREQIPRFFTIALITENPVRKRRLQELSRLDIDSIDKLDRKEFPEENSELKNYDYFVSQNIQACIKIADIYIQNSWEPQHVSEEGLKNISRLLLRYIALAQHPGLITPTPTERCMQAAFASALNSGCISRQVGAVITDKNYSIKSVGWNDVPKGQIPCLLRYSRDLFEGDKDEKAFSEFERNDPKFKSEGLMKFKIIASKLEQVDGRHIAYCFRTVYNKSLNTNNQVHTRALHAEENAFLQISKYGGIGIEGGYLFTTASPCELCAKKAYQLGIKKIYYIDPYPGITSSHIFGTGENPPILELFSGVVGKAYHELFEPLMSYKDEVATLLNEQQQQLFEV